MVKGDTLWGIAGKFLKDPYKWPQIWQMNQDQIKNPHRIYPGDVIRLDRSGPSLSMEGHSHADALANLVRLEPRVRVEPLESAVPTIPGAVIGPFLSQPLVIEENGLDSAPAIVATSEGRVIVAVGDTAYADRIGSSDSVNWQIFRPGQAVRDPESGEVLGYEAKYVGDARVRRFGHPTTLEITKARQEINRGDRLMPARETSFPAYVPRAPDKPIKGAIVSVDGGVSELGQYQIVSLNRGSRDGLQVGHVLASYHRGEVVDTTGRTRGFIDTKQSVWSLDTKPVNVVPDPPRPPTPTDGKVGVAATGTTLKLPDERNGLVFIFRVFEKMSYGMVMSATRPIYIGDLVQTP
ncbi:MAG: LysM peptidoglycan-binding domain-containing protein [Usitatibacter sp.]